MKVKKEELFTQQPTTIRSTPTNNRYSITHITWILTMVIRVVKWRNLKLATYSRVPNKRTGRLLENEKKSHLYSLIQTYTFINFRQKVPPIRLFPPKGSIPTYTFINFCTFTVQFYYLLKLFYGPLWPQTTSEATLRPQLGISIKN